MTIKKNFIKGEWVEGISAVPDVNRSNVADVGEYALADTAHARSAIAAARQAFPKWSLSSVQERAAILDAVGTVKLVRRDESMAFQRRHAIPMGG